MKQKFFLFIIAAFMATSSAWAWSADPEIIDAVPITNYLLNMTYDANLRTVTFDDQFHVGNMFTREYQVRVYDRDGSNFWSINGNSGIYYIYGDDNHNSRCVVISTGSKTRRNSTGGSVTIEIGDYLDQCYSQGAYKLRVFVVGWYVDPITSTIKSYVSENVYGDKLGSELTSYVDVDIPSVKIGKIHGGQYNAYQQSFTADNGDTLKLNVDISGINWLTFSWERSLDNGNTWTTCPNYFGGSAKNGDYLTANDARNGQELSFRYPVGNGEKNSLMRLAVEDNDTKVKYYSAEVEILFRYAFTEPSGTTMWYSAGRQIMRNMPQDCHEYKITSDLPVVQAKVDDHIEFTMPACDVQIEEVVTTYTVKFLNADYTVLKTEEVACGSDATAPADPTFSTYTFTGWSQDFTNVHKNMSVVARYDIGNTYWFDAYISNHENEVFPATGFSNSVTRAMVGDKLTFTADVFAATNATIAYETAFWDNNTQDYLWVQNGHITVANYTTPNQEQFFEQTINVCYYPNNSYINPFQRRMAVRFIMFIAGQTIYSDPWEIDIYYPLSINAPETDALYVENTAGDFNMGETNVFIPARYNDTVRVYSINGADGGCLSFARVLYPSRMLDSGIDENGNAFIICPGEQETINASVSEKLVVFDGVYGNGYPKQLDFTAQGFGKMNGYYGEVVPCGGSVTMPEDPTEDNAIFIGWEAWNTDYADDAYLHVPAVDDNIIGFTAKFEYLPEVPTYTVRFYGKDGSPLLDTQVINEGENATPPAAPEVSGYHFVGWDKPYTTITADVDITALYGEDAKTWTVTYRDVNEGSNSYIKIGEEVVNDGEAAAQSVALISKEGYTFAYWGLTNSSWKAREEEHADLSHVTSNMAVFARWKKSEYTITYTMDGADIFSEQVEHGSMPTAYQAIEDQGKPSTEQYVYTFDYWNPAIVAATADATYEAVFTQALRTYLVRFQNWDHTLLDEQQVAYGAAATAPADPTREGYTFTGWDREFNNILADMTVTALFEKNKNQGGDTGIEEIDASANLGGYQKLLIDGTLYIIRPDGKVFNAQGAEVK